MQFLSLKKLNRLVLGLCVASCVGSSSTNSSLYAEAISITHLNLDSKEVVGDTKKVEYENLASIVKGKTSIEMSDYVQEFSVAQFAKPSFPQQAWMYLNLRVLSKILEDPKSLSPIFSQWLRQGGFLLLEGGNKDESISNMNSLLDRLAERISFRSDVKARWREVPVEHELMRSFFLHTSFPSCRNKMWKVLEYDQRTVGVYAPFPWMEWLKDRNWTKVSELSKQACEQSIDVEFLAKIFVNVVMTALTTDYKMDQIHLPEILKRLQ